VAEYETQGELFERPMQLLTKELNAAAENRLGAISRRAHWGRRIQGEYDRSLVDTRVEGHTRRLCAWLGILLAYNLSPSGYIYGICGCDWAQDPGELALQLMAYIKGMFTSEEPRPGSFDLFLLPRYRFRGTERASEAEEIGGTVRGPLIDWPIAAWEFARHLNLLDIPFGRFPRGRAPHGSTK